MLGVTVKKSHSCVEQTFFFTLMVKVHSVCILFLWCSWFRNTMMVPSTRTVMFCFRLVYILFLWWFNRIQPLLLPSPHVRGHGPWLAVDWDVPRNDDSELVLYSYSHDSDGAVVPNFNFFEMCIFFYNSSNHRTIVKPTKTQLLSRSIRCLWDISTCHTHLLRKTSRYLGQ